MTNLKKPVYEIDGNRFSTLEQFYDEISRVLIPDVEWGRNLDAFNDILRGGFGTPEQGYVIVWKNSAVSRERLGFDETIRQLELRLKRCHSSNKEYVAAEINLAKQHIGATVYEWLLEIIRVHCQNGLESEDGVELILE